MLNDKLLQIKTQGNMGDWQGRHLNAMLYPHGEERPLRDLLNGWVNCAEEHKRQYGSVIGEDGALGATWEEIGLGLRALLNGTTGRLDCGTLDGIIIDTLQENGVDTAAL